MQSLAFPNVNYPGTYSNSYRIYLCETYESIDKGLNMKGLLQENNTLTVKPVIERVFSFKGMFLFKGMFHKCVVAHVHFGLGWDLLALHPRDSFKRVIFPGWGTEVWHESPYEVSVKTK